MGSGDKRPLDGGVGPCSRTWCNKNKLNEKNMTMTPVAKKAHKESFVGTDCEVELLLRLPLNYKANKLQENVDWELCQSKYLDLANAFRAQCPTEATEDFPHAATAVSKVQVTTKLKNICGKYRRAVDTGR